MKNILMYLIVFLCLFICIGNTNYVSAYNGEVIHELSEEEDCEGIFGEVDDPDSIAHFLQEVFTIIGYAAPVLVAALTVVDFSKAAAGQDKGDLVKCLKRASKRIILAFALFFLPTLINFFFHLFGWYGTCGIK